METTAQAAQLDTVHHFATPEHISFEFRLAGPMVRALAWLIDMLVKILILLVAYIIIGLISPSGGMAGGLALFLLFFINWIYNGLLEWLWHGYTPGKKALGIRVIGEDGLPISFTASFLRNTIRYADFLPMFYVTGMISIFFSGRFQRLGDLAAGTLVVYIQDSRNTRPVVIKNKQVERLLPLLPPETLSLVDAEAARAIANYASSRLHYHPDRRNEIAAHLAEPIAARLGLRRVKPDILLSAIYMKLFHGDVEESMGAKAARFLNKRRTLWQRLEKLLRRGKSKSGKPYAEELSQAYRSVCADLALADAYHLPPQNISYLHGLVSRSHLRFYQRIHVTLREVMRYLFRVAPGRLYNDSCLRIAFVAFFGVFFACMAIGAFDHRIAEEYVGSDTVMQMQQMYAEAPRDRDAESAAMMSGFYIFNNVGISFSCFASGVFAGIGSLIWLVFNGIYLGLIFGFMSSSQVDAQVQSHFFEFTSAHGPFELCGIMLSGAAGLRLGLGLIITRGQPRLESLQRSARESVPLMSVAALSVAFAAPIEAYISPSSLPISIKTAVQLISIVIILLYFLLGIRYREEDMLTQQRGPDAHR